MTFWSTLRVSWQAYKTRRKMNRQFSRCADPFSYATTPYETARLAAMDAALGAGPLGRVLEIGCAEGHFTEKLARRSSRVLAVDISDVALARARKRVPGAVFIEADCLSWEPGAELPFDAVIVSDVLYYLDRPGVGREFAALFARVASWLKPGGRLLLAHGFSGDKELAHRRSFRERFEAAGLKLVAEAYPGADRDGVRCLLSTLDKI